MIHIRVDDEHENSKRKFACGIGPDLPAGDVWFDQHESAARNADCQGCNPGGPHRLGTPISKVTGQPGTRGYEKFCEIAASWGYD